ncbi:copper homeostasis protein CutC [Ichthyenterobacterium sp. W332]|uniref:PF03932 family protein CutC n=1 Tax=Microcosmobacter mediterraneus TaxID=3075607 RepID=A0ABU2YHX0_9FLAO|nr:copper homeostasis protein CutC [Ichthyenterobacterium sp. W332]MDT0557746.1 copper homeostasis protein CutC [Ichthyenterobacterium sp. W332]
MLFEVCTPNYQSAKNAQEAGAHRIELCKELDVGGLTPSLDLLKRVSGELSIKTFILIRPRAGDFVYNDQEFEEMKNDIKTCKELGFDGIVSGLLNPDNTIDLIRTRALVELARPLEVTFHRAFDEVINPTEALEQLINLGVERVLTSGQKPKAEEGLSLLKTLKDKTQNKIIIVPGSGINPKNASIFKEAGFKEIHASASKEINGEITSDLNTIKAILDNLK